MAIWSIPSAQQVDYSPNGDDIDSFSQKVDYCLKEIFNSLRYLHENGATEGLDDSAAQPFEIRIDKANNELCIRNAENNDWIVLGKLDEHFGIRPKDIGALENGGGFGRLFMGEMTMEALQNSSSEEYETNDLYFSTSKKAIYRYTGSLWRVLLTTGDGGEILTTSSTVSSGGAANAGKILTLNMNGKLNTDVTGSAGALLGKPIKQTGELKNGQVLIYSPTENGGTGAFVNREVNVDGGGITVSNKTLTVINGIQTVGNYNGSQDTVIDIKNQQLTIKQGDSILGKYDGAGATTINIPTSSANKKLTLTQGTATVTYDGTESKTVTLPSANKTLTLTRGSAGVTYNGSQAGNLNLNNEKLTIVQGTKVVEYDGLEAQTIDLSGTVATSGNYANIRSLQHLQRLYLTDLIKGNEVLTRYTDGDGYYAEAFSSDKKGSNSKIDRTQTTVTLGDEGYFFDSTASNPQTLEISDISMASYSIARVYMILFVSGGNFRTSGLSAQVALSNSYAKYFDGERLVEGVKYVPMTRNSTPEPNIENVAEYYYEMPEINFDERLPRYVRVKLTLEKGSSSGNLYGMAFICD